MQLMAIGINHATADVALREKLAIEPESQIDALQALSHSLSGRESLCEAVILSTCNRTEIVVNQPDCELEVLRWLADYCDLELEVFVDHVYTHRGERALYHLIKVGAGLDSMVLGEPQILGQIKSAYAVSRKVGAIGSELEPLFQHVFAVVKKVRTTTAIGENPVSVAYAAVALAQRIYSDIKSVSALLIGAGEMIELVTRHIHDIGVSEITIANRTVDSAAELASRVDGRALLLADLPEHLAEFDIVISSTGSQLPILGKGAVEQALKIRKHRPMFMVDIAVPRDIEPQVAELSDVFLYTIDDLKEIIDHNLRLRASEADKAATIIDEGVREYRQVLHSRVASDLVVEYRNSAESICEVELHKAKKQLMAGEPAELVLDSFARALIRKLMHHPSVELRNAAARQDQQLLKYARILLGLAASDRDADISK